MQTKSPITLRKIMNGIMALGMLVTVFGFGNLSSVKAQAGSSGGVDYLIPESDSLPLEAKDAISLALSNWQYEAPANGRFSVLSLRQESNWALATVASADLAAKIPGQETSVFNGKLVSLVLVFDNNQWKAAVQGDKNIKTLLELIPENELSTGAKAALFPEADVSANQAYNNYKFPWLAGKAWQNHGAWHGSNNRALDFSPVDHVNADVVAAAPGYISAMAECTPSDHYIINITTEGTSEYMGYTHLSGVSVRAVGLKLGDQITQGQKLGMMAEGAFSGADSCGIASTGMHLHILMPVKPFTMEGKVFSDSYWYSNVDLFSSQTGTPSIFSDVPSTYWAWDFIERLYNAGITGGCSTSPLMYCPEATVSRAQMAIFILRGEHGSTYVPPAATGTMFGDVSTSTFGAAWIEQFSKEGITAGCGGGLYCPDTNVTRAQMAIFLLKGEHGSAYVPPVATGKFPDVPVGSFAADWIEQLSTEGITSGCGNGLYCPNTDVTRAQMAVFLVKAFSLP